MCVVGVYIRNIYYIYERFSDFRYGFGAGEFITEPNEAHTESVVESRTFRPFSDFHGRTVPVVPPHCPVRSRAHRSEPAVSYLETINWTL